MPKPIDLHITISPENFRFLKAQLETTHDYKNYSDVIRDALRVLQRTLGSTKTTQKTTQISGE